MKVGKFEVHQPNQNGQLTGVYDSYIEARRSFSGEAYITYDGEYFESRDDQPFHLIYIIEIAESEKVRALSGSSYSSTSYSISGLNIP